MSITMIRDQVLHLSAEDRVALIDLLWESLDQPQESEYERRWAEESEARIDAVDNGQLPTVDGTSALHQLRASLRK